MSLFDLFDSSNSRQAITNAATAQVHGLQNGLAAATNALNTGSNDLTAAYGAAGNTLQGLIGQYQPGATAYGNALGLNGTAGTQSALAALQATPGYQFALNQGTQNAMRQNAATGQLASGKTSTDLANYASGLADKTYSTYLAGLQPYLSGMGSATAGLASTQAGLGTALNANQGLLAQAGWNEGTGVGNAFANADTARAAADQQAGSNLLGLFGNVLSAGMKLI